MTTTMARSQAHTITAISSPIEHVYVGCGIPQLTGAFCEKNITRLPTCTIAISISPLSREERGGEEGLPLPPSPFMNPLHPALLPETQSSCRGVCVCGQNQHRLFAQTFSMFSAPNPFFSTKQWTCATRWLNPPRAHSPCSIARSMGTGRFPRRSLRSATLEWAQTHQRVVTGTGTCLNMSCVMTCGTGTSTVLVPPSASGSAAPRRPSPRRPRSCPRRHSRRRATPGSFR